MTLDTDISKSSCVTCWRLSRRANIPASVHTASPSAARADLSLPHPIPPAPNRQLL